MPTLLTHYRGMGSGSVEVEGRADRGLLPLTSPGTLSSLVSWVQWG